MSKLFNLKKWLTIDEAARHLSGVLTESVTAADLLRWALDDRLKLSVNFVNPVGVKLGTLVERNDIPYQDVVAANGTKYKHYLAIPYETEDGSLYIYDKTDLAYTVRGVCDIPLGEGFRLEVERKYQSITGGPKLNESPLKRVPVQVEEMDLCQFEMCLDEIEPLDPGESMKVLVQSIFNSPLSEEQTLNFIKEKLDVMRRTSKHCIVDELPEELVFVVRRKSLMEFIESVSGVPPNSEKPLAARERTSYLNIIGALLAQLTAGKANDTTVITQAVDDFGAKQGISERKLQEAFAAAKRSLGAG